MMAWNWIWEADECRWVIRQDDKLIAYVLQVVRESGIVWLGYILVEHGLKPLKPRLDLGIAKYQVESYLKDPASGSTSETGRGEVP